MPGPNTYDSFIRQALGEQKLGAEQFGPVAADAYGTYADTGDEPPTQPVFSAEQGLVENAWNNYRRFRENYDQTPPAYANTQLPGLQTAYQNYADSTQLPFLPNNQAQTKIDAADKQGPIDANVMLKAVESRQAKGRK